MAGMKRFVTYIYAYEDKKKGNNIGFARIEIRGEDCRLEIHLRGVYARQSVCSVYLFREVTGEIEGIRIGEMRLANGNGDFAGMVKAGRIGESPFGMGDMEGILLLTEDARIFMSRWKEGNPLVVCRENFRVWQPGQEQIEAAGLLEPEANAQGEHGENEQEERVEYVQEESEKNEQEEPEKVAENAADRVWETDEQDVQATEIPMRNVFPEYDWQNIWESLAQNRTLYHPFDDRAAVCIQIELKHLRELPKCYWYLGNNSFLLHGFFNYHYLVVGRTGEDRWFLGVPGIYQRQERVMAAIFGFPEFLAMAQEEKNGEENGEPLNRFGCWCRYIEE